MRLFITAAWVFALAVGWEPKLHAHSGHGTGVTNCLPVTNLTQFVDRLPIPAVAKPVRTNSNYRLLPGVPIPEYDMPMTSFQHQFHRDLPPVEVWGYAGAYPGPTIEAFTNAPILVNWINNLPAYPSWLTPDTNNHGVPDLSVRTTVHLHGHASRPQFDGHPESWFRSGQSTQYFYENIDFENVGETLWYHDHALGVTANNVYAGLEGFYILRNREFESQFQFPKGAYEIPLLFQDRDIQTNCSPASLMFKGIVPWHNLAVVNGKVLPYLEVEPRKYRFRLLNGANFRTFGLKFSPTNGVPLNWNVIGDEDGFLTQTVQVPTIHMMPAVRFDVIVDFSKFTNNYITLINQVNNADVPFGPFITNLMQFRVTLPLSSPDTTVIPVAIDTNLIPTATMVSQAVTNRQLTLDLCFPDPGMNNTNCEWLGGPFATDHHVHALIDLKYFEDPVTELPHAGDTEIWTIVNLTSEAHPVHVHLLDFRVVDRTRLGGWGGDLAYPPTMWTNFINDRRNGQLKPLSFYLESNSNPPPAYEAGPKDVVHAAPFSATRIVMTWPNDKRFFWDGESPEKFGDYVYHCHILDHEDNDMMRPMRLLPPRGPRLQAVFDPSVNPGGDNHIRLSISTKVGERYQIQTSSTLAPFSWTPIAGLEIQGTGGLVQFTPPPANGEMRFYRAELIIP